MALPPLVTVGALADWLGRVAFTGVDAVRADSVVNAASTAVRVEAGQNWVTADGTELAADIPVGIAEIVVRVAARMWANPTGAESTTTGPFSQRPGSTDLTEGERVAIQRIIAPTGAASGLWVLSTTRGDYETGTVYLPTSDGGTIPYLDDRDVL